MKRLCTLPVIFLFGTIVLMACPLLAMENEKNGGETIKTLTMEEAVRTGLINRPRVLALIQAVKAQQFGEKSAFSGYMPTISFSGSASNGSGARRMRTPTEATVTGNQLIYSFAGPIDLYKIAQQQTKATREQLEQNKDAVQFEIESAFLQAWVTQQRVRFIKSLEKTTDIVFRDAQAKEEQQILNKNDFLRATTKYTKESATVDQYVDEQQRAIALLEYRMGTVLGDHLPDLYWDADQLVMLKPLEFYYDLAFSNRKELRQKKFEEVGNKMTASFFRKKYLPSFNLFASYTTQNGTASPTVTEEGSATFLSSGSSVAAGGVSFQWNLFDGLTSYFEAEKSSAKAVQSGLELQELRVQIKSQVKATYHDLIALTKDLHAKEVEVAQERSVFQEQKLQYKIRKISDVEMQQARFRWRQIKFDWLSLQAQVHTKVRELVFVCGYPPSMA